MFWIRLHVFAFLCAAGHVYCSAQGLLVDEKRAVAICEEAIIAYASGRDFGGAAISATLHGEIRSELIKDGGVSDWVCGFAEIPEDDFRYEFAGFKNPVALSDRYWKQTLNWDGRTMIRSGGNNRYDQIVFDADPMRKRATDEKPPGMVGVPSCDPYWLPLVTFGGLYGGDLGAGSGERILLANCRFVGGFAGRLGNAVGVWQLFGDTGTIIEIDFGASDSPVPERVVWRLANGQATIENYKRLHVFGVSRCDWGVIKHGDDEFKLPIAIEFVEFDDESIPSAEVSAFVEWTTGKEVVKMAKDSKEAFDFRKLNCDWLKAANLSNRQMLFEEAKAVWRAKRRRTDADSPGQ